jgi:hypothetical protein
MVLRSASENKTKTQFIKEITPKQESHSSRVLQDALLHDLDQNKFRNHWGSKSIRQRANWTDATPILTWIRLATRATATKKLNEVWVYREFEGAERFK